LMHCRIPERSCWCGGGRLGTVGGRFPGCFFWVSPKRSSPKPDPHWKGITQL